MLKAPEKCFRKTTFTTFYFNVNECKMFRSGCPFSLLLLSLDLDAREKGQRVLPCLCQSALRTFEQLKTTQNRPELKLGQEVVYVYAAELLQPVTQKKLLALVCECCLDEESDVRAKKQKKQKSKGKK